MFSLPPLVSYPDMHHGTCLTHLPWCKPESLTSGFGLSRWRGNRSWHSRCMHNTPYYASGKRPIATLVAGVSCSILLRYILSQGYVLLKLHLANGVNVNVKMILWIYEISLVRFYKNGFLIQLIGWITLWLTILDWECISQFDANSWYSHVHGLRPAWWSWQIYDKIKKKMKCIFRISHQIKMFGECIIYCFIFLIQFSFDKV